MVLNENGLFLALAPLALLQGGRGVGGGARSRDPPDEVIMWKQSVWNPPLTPVTPLCYTTPGRGGSGGSGGGDTETQTLSSTGQHFLWLWLHWSWFTVNPPLWNWNEMSESAALARSVLAAEQRGGSCERGAGIICANTWLYMILKLVSDAGGGASAGATENAALREQVRFHFTTFLLCEWGNAAVCSFNRRIALRFHFSVHLLFLKSPL